MPRKKTKSPGGQLDNPSLDTPIATTAPAPKNNENKRPATPSTSALIICRNKHWRYISSFHGPWLQLPPEVLESLANNNYNLPRPRPIDPAVFFDLLKVRRLVDEATSLAVRAASGVTSSQLNNSLNAGNGLMGNGGSALGLGLSGGGGNAKLSRERKHRMREQATQKLSKAYHLDEIACSVATMQSASSLEDVAQLVLQRSPDDPDAKYVHFFHEKIPSRQLAECTSLEPLDEVIADKPMSGEPLRTRAVTRIFKEDFVGAAKDLTEALSVCRYYQGQHKAGRQQLQLASAATDTQRNGRWKEEIKLDEEDHPSSLEAQILFHRAGVYLTIACQHVEAALPPRGSTKGDVHSSHNNENANETDTAPQMTPAEKAAHLRRLEARKIVKTNAKKALRDYVAYLSHLDYTPGLPSEITEEFVRQVNQVANGYKIPRPQYHSNGMDVESNASLSNGQLSDALVPHNGMHTKRSRTPNSTSSTRSTELPSLPTPVVYQMSTLFSSTPPADLPPYPATTTALTAKQRANMTPLNETAQAILARTDCHEALTYHPLLTDALHSLLLCHCLVQTSTKELLRHAHMVARLARVCDGYPIFQAARSPSRSDWIEVLRRGDNWIQLSQSWEMLCTPAPLPGHASSAQQKETVDERRERLKQQAIMEALEDDRVHDEASFHAAVKARQARQEEDARRAGVGVGVGVGGSDGNGNGNGNGNAGARRWAQEDGKDYPISTDRAQAIVRWVREAPLGGETSGTRRKKKGKTSSKGKAQGDVEGEMAALKVGDDDYEAVEEEVD